MKVTAPLKTTSDTRNPSAWHSAEVFNGSGVPTTTWPKRRGGRGVASTRTSARWPRRLRSPG